MCECRRAFGLEERVEQGKGAGGLSHRDGARDDARIVAPAHHKVGILHTVEVDAGLVSPDGRRGLEGHAPHHGQAGGDAAEDAPRAIGLRANAPVLHPIRIVVLAAA